MADTTVARDAQVEHIGATPHPTRNLVILGGGLALAGLITAFYRVGGQSDRAASAELDRFRQAVFNKCHIESFGGPTDPRLASLYADSSRMRSVVGEQLGSLDRGQANCDQLIKSLRSVDYPVP